MSSRTKENIVLATLSVCRGKFLNVLPLPIDILVSLYSRGETNCKRVRLQACSFAREHCCCCGCWRTRDTREWHARRALAFPLLFSSPSAVENQFSPALSCAGIEITFFHRSGEDSRVCACVYDGSDALTSCCITASFYLYCLCVHDVTSRTYTT